MSSRYTIICDKCKEEIENKIDRVNASVYGADFHISCFNALTPKQVLDLLGLDYITLNNRKYWYRDERN